MGDVAGSWGWPTTEQVRRTGPPAAVPPAWRLLGSWVSHPAGTSSPQTVPVTLLGLRACNRLLTTLESDAITLLPGMVCTSVVGELPRCEVSPGTPKPYPTDPWHSHPATHQQTFCQAWPPDLPLTRNSAFLPTGSQPEPEPLAAASPQAVSQRPLPDRACLGHHSCMK